MTVAADLTPKTAEKLSELSGILRPPVGTNKEGAIAYLGCSERKFDELRRKGIVRALDRGWYAYADLDAAVEWLRGYGRDESGREIRSEGDGPDNRSSKELLFLDLPSRRRRKGRQDAAATREGA